MRVKIDPLDKLFSEFIRKRAMIRVHGCERCLAWKESWKQLQCSHFYGRSKRSVRFDEDNAIGICGACHLYLTAHPLEQVEFFKTRLGERGFDMLNSRMRRMEKIDRKLLELYYQNKIKEEK